MASTTSTLRAFVLARYAEFEPAGTYMPTHACGMPSGWAVTVRTRRALVDGRTALWVYPDRVVLATIEYPTNHRNWRVVTSVPYTSTDELQTILDDLTEPVAAPAWETA